MMVATLGADEAAERLARLFATTPRDEVRLHAFAPGRAPRRVVAVDGSNVTLAESGSHLLGAFRAGRVDLLDGEGAGRIVRPPEVVLLSAEDGARPLRERLAAHGLGDLELPRLAPSAVLEHLRSLAELASCLEALDDLRARDLLLVDGALQARATLPLLDRLLVDAKARGVDVVGVCKSTSMTVGATPAFAACRLAARGFDGPTWYAELPAPPAVRARVLVARLNAAETRPFRFDVAAADGDAPRVLAALAALAGHPAYPGYPSPLAMAHNAALLTEEDRLRLRAAVHEAALARGVREADWEAVFLDYHDVLELGA